MWRAYLFLECVVMTELQQITIRHILHIESSWKDKQFSLHSPSVSHMKRLKMSRSFYIRRWEQCRRLMRGREGHQEAGEMEVGDRKMRVGRRGGMKSSEDEMREGEQYKEWKTEGQEWMIAVMCLHEWQPCMNIVCVMTEWRRSDLNALLTRSLSTPRNRKGLSGRCYDNDRREQRAREKCAEKKKISESKGKEKWLYNLLADTARAHRGTKESQSWKKHWTGPHTCQVCWGMKQLYSLQQRLCSSIILIVIIY